MYLLGIKLQNRLATRYVRHRYVHVFVKTTWPHQSLYQKRQGEEECK